MRSTGGSPGRGGPGGGACGGRGQASLGLGARGGAREGRVWGRRMRSGPQRAALCPHISQRSFLCSPGEEVKSTFREGTGQETQGFTKRERTKRKRPFSGGLRWSLRPPAGRRREEAGGRAAGGTPPAPRQHFLGLTEGSGHGPPLPWLARERFFRVQSPGNFFSEQRLPRTSCTSPAGALVGGAKQRLMQGREAGGISNTGGGGGGSPAAGAQHPAGLGLRPLAQAGWRRSPRAMGRPGSLCTSAPEPGWAGEAEGGASPPPGGVPLGRGVETHALWLLRNRLVAPALGARQCWLRMAVTSGSDLSVWKEAAWVAAQTPSSLQTLEMPPSVQTGVGSLT